MIRYYTDEHVRGAVISALRARGINVFTAKEAGLLGASDEAHLAFASHAKRVLFSHDRDFLRLHAQRGNHAGIVYTHQRTSVGDIIRGLVLIHAVLTPREMENRVEFL